MVKAKNIRSRNPVAAEGKEAAKPRSKSAGAKPYEHKAAATARGKHAQMTDLMNAEDRRALSMNKYEE